MALLVGHFPLLVATLAEGRLLSALILLLSETFFLLKLLDVRWLRLAGGPRALLAFVLVVMLLHAPLLRRAAAAQSEQVAPWGAVVLAVLAAPMSALLRRVGLVVWLRDGRRRAREHAALLCRQAAERAALLPPRFLLFVRRLSVHRAPPVCAF